MKITINNHQLNFSSCHRIPERSFFFRGKQFPFCARCTGINASFLLIPIFTLNIIVINLAVSFLLMAPAVIDGLTQAFCNRESNNYLRLTTGLMMGLGLNSISAHIGKGIGALIINLIN
jgi:uncharacterized membrane protein